MPPWPQNHLVRLAEQNGIRYQMEVLELGGTDSGAIQMTREGIPAAVISVPSRYIHTPGEMVDISDVEECIKLCVAVCESPLEI